MEGGLAENVNMYITVRIGEGEKTLFKRLFIFTLTGTIEFLFTLPGTIESGLPTLQLPQFGTSGSLPGGNGTEVVGAAEPASLGTMISRFC